jgi:hypothetical protein
MDNAEVCPMRYKAHKTMINRLNTLGIALREEPCHNGGLFETSSPAIYIFSESV